ncbi:MAG: type II toxin-antitoxin system HicB family antitoxin [Actinobacteria bacterium]|nr:type II toxin-antitoxin system HicB family antitoxin [Actinomycetota bacterium]
MSKINISIPEDFLSEIDKYKKIKKVTRSQFLINAASTYFNVIESEIAIERKKNAVNKLRKTRQDIMKLVSGKHEVDVVEQLRKMRQDREKEIEKRVTGK